MLTSLSLIFLVGLAAVSPAVVVPRMVQFIEKGRGTEKGIPQMIMEALLERAFLLRHCISSKGDGAGGNRFCATCCRTFLWENSAVGRSNGNYHHSTIGSVWN